MQCVIMCCRRRVPRRLLWSPFRLSFRRACCHVDPKGECDMTLSRASKWRPPGRLLTLCRALLTLGVLVQVIDISKVEAMGGPSFECTVLSALHDKLQFQNREKFMKFNFPINYRIDVPHILVFRRNNVTQLLQQNVTVVHLRVLWRIVNDKVLQRIQDVLTPAKHPSWNYTAELKKVILVAESRVSLKGPDGEIFREKWNQVKRSDSLTLLKPVRPKALIDNCYKVLMTLHKGECGLL